LAEARREYELALENKANDSEALRALDRIDDELETRSRNEQMYVTERTRGDVFLEQGNYQPALQSYEAALTRKPGDSYAQSKIDEINRVFSARNEQEAELPDGMIDENGIYNFTEDPPVLVGGRDVLQSRLRYPALAIEAGVEGRVSVRMAVDETGKMLNPTVIKALGYGCDDEVLRVIRGARFEPARVGGQPVKAWHTLYFDFKLEDQ
jgi:TonB family protein